MARHFLHDATACGFSTGSAVATAPVSMAAWVFIYDMAAASIHKIAEISNGGLTNRLTFDVATSGGLGQVRAQSAYTPEETTLSATAQTSVVIPGNCWFHAAAVFTSTTSRDAYFNGEIASNSSTNSPTGLNKTSIGIGGSGASPITGGMLAEVAIWNVALVQEDILALVAGAPPWGVRPGSLVFYNPMKNARGEIVNLIDGVVYAVAGNPTGGLHPPRMRRPRRQRIAFAPIADTIIEVSPIVMVIGTVAPTLTLELTQSPDAIAVPVIAVDPTVEMGELAVAVDPVAVPVIAVDPTVEMGELAVSIDATAIPLATVDPTLALELTQAPDPVAVPVLTVNPTLDTPLDIAVTPITVPVLAVDPALALELTQALDPVAVPVLVVDPTLDCPLDIAPDPVAVPVVVVDPTIDTPLEMAPNPLPIPTVLVEPDAVTLELTLEPDPISIPILTVGPTLDMGELALSLDPVAIVMAVAAPTLALELLLTPEPIAIIVVATELGDLAQVFVISKARIHYTLVEPPMGYDFRDERLHFDGHDL